MHVYVAGPMRKYQDFNFPAFEKATATLRKLGHEVFNPAERDLTAGFKSVGMTGHEDLSKEGFDLRAALAADLKYITETADALCVLEGWENSSGARAEVATARALGLPVVRNGGFLYNWAGKYPYRAKYVVKPELAPSGKIATVTPIADKIKYQSADLSQTNTWNINPSDITNTLTGIMQDKLDAKHTTSAADLLRRKRVMEGRTLHESDADEAAAYAHFEPITAEQRLGFDPDAVASYQNIPDIVNADGEVRSVSSTGGEKGTKLARYDLIPVHPLEELAKHFGRGALKYDDNQWRKGYEWSKSYAALQRHLTAFWDGEDIDAETGSPHLAAVAWHAFALIQFAKDFPEFDDRYPHATS
jgi:hypothetical protein